MYDEPAARGPLSGTVATERPQASSVFLVER